MSTFKNMCCCCLKTFKISSIEDKLAQSSSSNDKQQQQKEQDDDDLKRKSIKSKPQIINVNQLKTEINYNNNIYNRNGNMNSKIMNDTHFDSDIDSESIFFNQIVKTS